MVCQLELSVRDWSKTRFIICNREESGAAKTESGT